MMVLPFAVEVAVSVLIVLGAVFALIGSMGLLRFSTFYERVHPPTLGTTFGTVFVSAASMLLFSTLATRPVLQELVLIVFVALTTPITYTLLVRAAILRDRAEGQAPTAPASGRPHTQ